MNLPYLCQSCRGQLKQVQRHNGSIKRTYHRPTYAPKPIIDLKHIRQNPGLYEQNCIDRNYKSQSRNSWRILELHDQLVGKQKNALKSRRKNNALGKEIQRQAGMGDDGQGSGKGGVTALVEEARKLKEDLKLFEQWEGEVRHEMEGLALEIPNLTSNVTPLGEEPSLLGYINGDRPTMREGKSHVEIGKELDILDFEASATTSGRGWYFLKNEAALLEQALIQYALSVALSKGWKVMTPPSLVHAHIASACGFMPRDQNGETQRYAIANDSANEDFDKPSLVLAGTAEIPFAGFQANETLLRSELPLKVIGPSRSYRAEAGAAGVDTKGLYRVHEFTKVEMFAWTAPPGIQQEEGQRFGSDEDEQTQSETVFEEMLSIQTQILTDLGLHAKILEMPTTDLGASASRKVDIEAFFPSRTAINGGYGEVTSASTCTDYQTRRLNTRLKNTGGAVTGFPHTLNGTAMAVPRVLAAILENGWNANEGVVEVPEVLVPYMLGRISKIGLGRSNKT